MFQQFFLLFINFFKFVRVIDLFSLGIISELSSSLTNLLISVYCYNKIDQITITMVMTPSRRHTLNIMHIERKQVQIYVYRSFHSLLL